MSVIIPAILRALDVGDPFMQEDTVGPGFTSTVEIAPMTLTRVELGLPTTRPVDDSGSDDCEGVIGSVTPKGGLDEKDDQKHRLTTQVSDGSLGTLVATGSMSHADECDVPATKSFEVRSLPVINKHPDAEGDAEESKLAKRQTS